GERVLGDLASPVFAFAARGARDHLEAPVPALSQHREVVFLRRADGAECDRLFEGDEPAVVCGGQCEQVGVGDLLGPVYPPAVDERAVEQADRARPELVVLEARGAGEQVHGLAWWDGAGIAGLADDPHEAVLGDRARGPAVLYLGVDPVAGELVIDMVAVEQSQQDVDVQQRASHTASSSRSRSISAFEIASPRCGSGSNPWKDSAARSASAGASWPVN